MTADYKLSEGILEMIMNGGTVSDPIVQVLGHKKMISGINNNNRYRLVISDGKFKVNIAMYTAPVNNHEELNSLEMYSIIKLKRYFTNVMKHKDKGDTRILLILELESLAAGNNVGHVIGEPIFLTDNETNSQYSEISNSVGTVVTLKQIKREQVSRLSDTNFISPISSLNPFHNNWIIKARVLNKTNIRNWSNAKGEGKLFSVDLVDKSGEIRCTGFKDLVDKFFDLLEVDKIYFISKCLLQPINRQFCSLNHQFEMVFISETIIEESLNNNEMIPQMKYNFTTIDKIATMVAGTVVDVIAVCKSSSEIQAFTSKSTNRELKKKDILLVDNTKTGIVLTLWGVTAESFTPTDNPVISVKSAKVYEFQKVKSLSLAIGGQIKTDPNLPEALKLKAWYELEGNQTEFNNVSARITTGRQMPWMTFKEAQQRALHDTDGLFFQTLGTILLIRLDRTVYKSCLSQDCQKKVTDLENGMYRCEKCNREYSNFKYRFLLSMNLSDASGSQWITMFTAEAEKLLGKTAQEIGETMENDQEIVGRLFEELQFQQFVFKCKAKMENYNDDQRVKVFVVGVSPLIYKEHNAYLKKRIEELRGIIKN